MQLQFDFMSWSENPDSLVRDEGLGTVLANRGLGVWEETRVEQKSLTARVETGVDCAHGETKKTLTHRIANAV